MDNTTLFFTIISAVTIANVALAMVVIGAQRAIRADTFDLRSGSLVILGCFVLGSAAYFSA